MLSRLIVCRCFWDNLRRRERLFVHAGFICQPARQVTGGLHAQHWWWSLIFPDRSTPISIPWLHVYMSLSPCHRPSLSHLRSFVSAPLISLSVGLPGGWEVTGLCCWKHREEYRKWSQAQVTHTVPEQCVFFYVELRWWGSLLNLPTQSKTTHVCLGANDRGKRGRRWAEREVCRDAEQAEWAGWQRSTLRLKMGETGRHGMHGERRAGVGCSLLLHQHCSHESELLQPCTLI